MATYIQGLTDTNYSPLLNTPDYSFLKNILDKSTQNYQTGLSKLSASYNSITNTPLTKDGLKTERENYIKLMQKELSRVAGTDLSMPENVSAADSIFAPFWENKEMLIDSNFTRQQNAQIERQEAMKTSSDKEIREQYSTIPGIVMQNRMEKVRKAKVGDLSVYQEPIVESVPFYNLADEAADYIKKMDYKITRTVGAGGRIETTINGPGTEMSYYELLNQIRGEKYKGQDNIMGQYHTLQAINDIKANNATKGIELTDEQAQQQIPDYYAGIKIKQLNEDKTINNERVKTLTDKLSVIQHDSTKQADITELVDQIESLNAYGNELTSQITAWKNKNSEEYQKTKRNVSFNPSGFFAQIYAATELNAVSRVLANNQSKKIEEDKAYWEDKKLQQNWIIEHDKLTNARIIAEEKEDKRGEKTSVLGRTGSYDINGNFIPDDKEKGDVTDAYNMPTVSAGKDDIKLLTPVAEAKKYLVNEINRITASQFQIFQTAPSGIIGKYISSDEANAMYSAVFKNDYSDPLYRTAINNVRNKLLKEGIIKNTNEINGPLGAMNILSSAIISDIENTITAAQTTPGNAELAAKAEVSSQLYIQLQANSNALNNMYSKQTQFNKDIDKEFSNAKYEKVRYKKGNEYHPVDSDYLQSKYTIPKEVADGYLSGDVKLKSENIYELRPTRRSFSNDYDTTMEVKIGEKKFIEYNGKSYDVTTIYNAFGSPKDLRKNLDKADKDAGDVIKNATYAVFKGSTGARGQIITYGSDQKGDKIDMGQNIAEDVLGAGNKYEMYGKTPIVNLGDTDKDFANEVFNRIKSNIGEGLSKIKLHTISPYNPSKRAVELVYTNDQLEKLFTEKEKKQGNFEEKMRKFKSRPEGLMVELRDNEIIKGFPEAAYMKYYEMLLSENVNKTPIKQTPMEEKLGIKYEISKDGMGQIKYKTAVKMIIPDPTDATKTISKWVNPFNLNQPEELISYSYLGPKDDIEKFVIGLQTTASEIFSKNLKASASMVPVVKPVADVNPTLAARVAAILKP